LDVVDREQQRPLGRERREDTHQRRRTRPWIRRLVGFRSQQDSGQCAILRRRKRRARLVECAPDEIGKDGVRELRFTLRRPRLQHPEAAILRGTDRLQPDRRLADSGLALEQQRSRTFRDRVDERGDYRKLPLAPHERLVLHLRHSTSQRQRLRPIERRVHFRRKPLGSTRAANVRNRLRPTMRNLVAKDPKSRINRAIPRRSS
jgi:hypothetical protein